MTAVRGSLGSWLGQAAGRRRERQLGRTRRPLRRIDAVHVLDGDDKLLNFCSNDYLGLASHPELEAALADGAASGGTGSGASALISGYHPEHLALEEELADYLERDAALLFSSGYLANLAVATSLAGRGDAIVQDRLCHASLIDAARLSGARLLRYPHLDTAGLQRQLDAAEGQHLLAVTDGVFSMDGDVAPLEGIAAVCGAAGAWPVVDDAHGIGVLGPGGRGCVAAAGLGQQQVPVLVGTLGKAFGCAGAFVAGSRALIEHLVNEGRSYLYTTAMPPALAAAGRAALARVRGDDWRRHHLAELIERFREGAARRGLPLLPSSSPIQPVLAGSAAAALRLAGELRQRGFLVVAIRPPTVPRGGSRLRVTLSAAHTPQQVDDLLEAIEACLADR
jgi:8-amino-7-oxononanoate synthase